MGFLKPLIIDKKQTAVCLELDGNYKRGDVFYWNNNFDYAQKGYYEIIDDSYKKDNLYLCIKKAKRGRIMKDKIIVDGIDVSECEFYNDVECNAYRQEYWESQDNTRDLCKEHPNCYFKQLQILRNKKSSR